MRCYVSGPMRGFRNFNFGTFDSVTRHLRKIWEGQATVLSPAEHDRDIYPDIEKWEGFAWGDVDACPDFDLVEAMRWDLSQVATCDQIVMLPGWEGSTGATHERYVAEVCGVHVYLATPTFPTVLGAAGERLVWHLAPDEIQIRVSAPRNEISEPHALEPLRELRRQKPYADQIAVAQQHEKPLDYFVAAANPRVETIGQFPTKDSGARVDFPSGMRRDTDDGKPRYDLIPVGPHRRLAELYARGAVKYGDNNWRNADSPEELQRFKASAERHFMQWKAGEEDEDHAIAVVWNVYAALWLEEKMGPL